MRGIQNRVAKLEADHKAADEQILELQKCPGADTLQIKELKRQKLRIKEQLKQLKTQVT